MSAGAYERAVEAAEAAASAGSYVYRPPSAEKVAELIEDHIDGMVTDLSPTQARTVLALVARFCEAMADGIPD